MIDFLFFQIIDLFELFNLLDLHTNIVDFDA